MTISFAHGSDDEERARRPSPDDLRPEQTYDQTIEDLAVALGLHRDVSARRVTTALDECEAFLREAGNANLARRVNSLKLDIHRRENSERDVIARGVAVLELLPGALSDGERARRQT